MDLSKVKPSKNIKDHTGYGPVQRALDSILTLLNPVYAYRNVTGAAKRQGVDLRNTPPSKYIEDQTGNLGGAMRERLERLNNFLNQKEINRKSLENNEYWSGLGQLPEGKKFPFRPVEGLEENIIEGLLTNPKYTRDERYSAARPESPVYQDFMTNFLNPPIYRGSRSKKIKERY